MSSPTGSPRRIYVDSTSILRRYVEDQVLTDFHVISTYFFDVILLIEKPTLFPRTIFGVISMFKKSSLLLRTFFGVILMVQKSTLFPRIFFEVILMVEKSTLFAITFFDEISMGKNSTSFLVSCELMTIYRECTREPFNFLTINTTLSSSNPLKFRKHLFDTFLKNDSNRSD